MYENQVLDDNSHRQDGLGITAESRESLRVAAKWAGFLAIIGFVMLGLMAIFSFSIGALMKTMSENFPMADPSAGMMIGMMSGSITGFMLIFLVIYFFPTYYLYKFSRNTKDALKNNDTDALTGALRFQAKFFKYLGVFTAIILGLYAAIILLVILVGIAM